MNPPSVTGEVYYFPPRQLIFRFCMRVILSFKRTLQQYIPKSIPSVCTTIFKRIALLFFFINVWCYASMDSSQ